MPKNSLNTGMQASAQSRRGTPSIEIVNAGPDVTTALFKQVKRCMAPATPATWSKYIDSRMKQFCTR
jgi:hypothetical protein